jgi:very-short-patch-repair endonuclease
LKGKKLDGFKFRRQYGIGRYVIDFFCVQKKLAVEIDGEVHHNKDSNEYDLERDDFIKGFGIKVMRFRAEDVERDIDGVLKMISSELK